MPWWVWTCWIGAGIAGVLALGVLYVALVRDRSRGRRRCPKCWYDMSGVPGLRCPECGREARREKGLFRTRRRLGLAAVGVVLGLVSYVGARMPDAVARDSWTRLVPDPVLGLVLPLWDAEGDRLLSSYGAGWGGFMPGGPVTRWEKLLTARALARSLGPPGGHRPIGRPAGFLLQHLRPDNWPAKGIVLSLTRSDDPATREHAIYEVAGVVPDADSLVSVLLRALEDEEPRVRSAAVTGLIRAQVLLDTDLADNIDWYNLGAPSPLVAPSGKSRLAALQALARELDRSADPDERIRVVQFLGRVGTDQPWLMPFIERFIVRADRKGAAFGVSALAQFGRPAAPFLIRLLSHSDPKVVAAAAAWVGTTDVPGGEAVPRLGELIADPAMAEAQDAVLWALLRIGRPSAAVSPQVHALAVSCPEVRPRMMAVLVADSMLSEKALPTLVLALSDREETIRRAGASGLERLGPAAAAAAGALEALADDPKIEVREAAARALEAVRGRE